MLRTHTCGELSKKNVGKYVKLCGWVDTIRSYGKLNFVDLRDRYGKTQIVIKGSHELKPEYCVRISGDVKARKSGTENENLGTGDVEVLASEVEIFNESPILPFEINDEKVGEDVRLKFRYFDLKCDKMQTNLVLRHNVNRAINDYMDNSGFLNIETPILGKSTPEGARDFVVPSRVHAGKFYALPQSPQLFKQMLMIGGYDKYYQIAKCFRDEDSRADRQPEFTQLDVEMSFVEVEDVLTAMESLWKYVFDKVLGIKLKTPFPRITYAESMKKYNRDNPDVRKKGERFSFIWVIDFPMFEYNDEDKRWYATHHPFTMPLGDDYSNPKKVKSAAYDLVLNGVEIGGGSIRIHDLKLQENVFKILGISKVEASEKFGFLMDALAHGAPPHGGIAFGLDRVMQLITDSDSIREVIAFPKNKAGQDVMLNAPSEISRGQLKDAHVKLDLGGVNGGVGKKGKK